MLANAAAGSEKNSPEAADRHVEAGGVEAMHLGVA
jgi:hypothetical protein